MRRASAAVVVVLALSSCTAEGPINPVPGPPIGYASGSRLRARVRSSAPGARQLVGWRDTKLGVDCTFTTAEDGALRCIPGGTEVLFLDELCQKPIAVVSAACGGSGPPAFASTTVLSEETCGGVTRAFRLGDAVDVPNSHAYVGAGASGGCLRTAQLEKDATAYALDPIDPADLVKGTLARAPKSDRLGVEVIVAEDGAQQHRGLYDVATKGRCFSIAGAIGGGDDRCIPNEVAWATYAADPACATPVAYQVRPTSTCPSAGVVVSYGFKGCDVHASFFAPADTVDITDVFTGAAPVCTLVRKQPALFGELQRDHVFYQVGAPVAATTFAPMRSQTTGLGRLAVPILAAADGTELTPPRPDVFFDTTLGVLCRAYVFPDGVKRCVPRDAVPIATPSFSDDACSAEVVGVPQSPGCTAAPVYAVRVTAGPACSTDVAATNIVKLDATPQTLPSYYTVDATGACAKQAQGGVFASITGEVPKTSLAVVVEAVE